MPKLQGISVNKRFLNSFQSVPFLYSDKQTPNKAQQQGYHHRDDAGGHADVDVGLLVLAVGHGQQGQHGAVVGQGVQTAGGDGSNTVEVLRAHTHFGSLFQVLGTQGFQGDRHTAGGRAGGTGQGIDGHSFGEQNGAGHIHHSLPQQSEAGNDLNHRTEAHGAGGVHNGGDGAVCALVDGGRQTI